MLPLNCCNYYDHRVREYHGLAVEELVMTIAVLGKSQCLSNFTNFLFQIQQVFMQPKIIYLDNTHLFGLLPCIAGS